MQESTRNAASFAASRGPSDLDALTDEQQRRLTDVLDRYLRSLEAGFPPPADQILEAHPDLAEPLRRYLNHLLELHDAAAAFGRDVPEPRGAAQESDDERRLGDFVLLREVGRGGMGVVYEARQISLSRRVALKVLPFAAVLESQQIVRFKNEAQAAAQLHHPNIVPVYAVGSERGVHYYAMQFIDGQPLDRAIAELRGAVDSCVDPDVSTAADAATRASSFLSGRRSDRREYFRAVMRLGIQAAEALDAAHGYGIVHRDIKPSNLLLDGNGKLWVTDFGLARCQGDLSLTKTGVVIGTKQYMSPEQALGQAALVDQRTDTYSLGATLYELLTLRPAFDAQHSATPLHRIDQQEPVRPRALEPLLPVDLETVVQKAMARRREDRYLTAQELADDLTRVLSGQPTIARPPTFVDRLGKFARRHRRIVVGVAAVGVVAMIGLAAAALLINRERIKAQRDFARAEQYFRQAQETVDLFGSHVAERLADVPGAERVRRELLDETLKYYQQFVAQAGNDPALWSDLALTYGKIGTLNDQMGLTAESIRAHEKAITLLEKLADQQPSEREHRRRLAVCQNNLALTVSRAGRTDDARRAFYHAIARQQQLVAEDPDNALFRGELALSHNNLGSLQRDTGATKEARTSFGEAIRLEEELAKAAPEDTRTLGNLAAAYNNLAALNDGNGQAGSLELYAKAVEYQRAVARARPAERTHQSDLARMLSNLGAAQARDRQFEEAATTYHAAIVLQKELLRVVPLDRTYRGDLAVSYNNLGLAHIRLQQPDVAERCFRNALGFQEQLVAERPADFEMQSSVGGIHNNLGIVLEQRERYEEAAQSYAKAAEFQRAAQHQAPTVERYRTFLSKHYFNHGRVLRHLGRCDEAVSVALERKKLWPNDPQRLLSVAEELALAGRLAVADEPRVTSPERCAELALATLREAVSAGLHVPADLDRRDAFVDLKGRPGYAELVK